MESTQDFVFPNDTIEVTDEAENNSQESYRNKIIKNAKNHVKAPRINGAVGEYKETQLSQNSSLYRETLLNQKFLRE